MKLSGQFLNKSMQKVHGELCATEWTARMYGEIISDETVMQFHIKDSIAYNQAYHRLKEIAEKHGLKFE